MRSGNSVLASCAEKNKSERRAMSLDSRRSESSCWKLDCWSVGRPVRDHQSKNWRHRNDLAKPTHQMRRVQPAARVAGAGGTGFGNNGVLGRPADLDRRGDRLPGLSVVPLLSTLAASSLAAGHLVPIQWPGRATCK